jgi:HlyD family secretion protein
MDNLMIRIPVSEVDINNIHIGQEATITFDAISNKEYTGYVSSVADAGEEDNNSMVQFDIWVKLEEEDDQVKPGFTSVVSIVTDEVKDALLVPYDAVVANEDGSYAVVLEDGTSLPVEIGIKSDTYIEILSDDIEEGDTVILH